MIVTSNTSALLLSRARAKENLCFSGPSEFRPEKTPDERRLNSEGVTFWAGMALVALGVTMVGLPRLQQVAHHVFSSAGTTPASSNPYPPSPVEQGDPH